MTREEYYNLHKYCPKCGGHYWTSTLVGYICTENTFDNFKDLNRIDCSCGWSGSRHDLVAKPKNE
jgi:hypothetical protein